MEYRNYKTIDGEMFEKFITNGAINLKQNVKEINDLNVFPIPDGDTGDNMYRTISGGIQKMQKETSIELSKKAKALAEGMLFNARGNSGVILSQLFFGLAIGLENKIVADLADIIFSFEEAVRKAYQSVVPPVEGTILTVAREAVEKTKAQVTLDMTIGEFGKHFITNMYESLENTPELLSILKEAGVIDSGGAGLYRIIEGIYDAINGNTTSDGLNFNQDVKELDFSLFTEDSELKFGYCTEFLLRLQNKKTDVEAFSEQTLIDYLNTIGDSIVCFKTGSIVKAHVHTFTPDKALAYAQNFGEFLTVKIENMTLQHSEAHLNKEVKNELPKAVKSRHKYATIVVASGKGFKDLFSELGVDYFIDGGQGKNPSTNDFLEAFDLVNAENIYVFPNNSNIILAVKQAKDIYDKSNIYILETKNVGQAYSSLAMLDYSLDNPDDLYNLFNENLLANKTALICKATRDVLLNGIDVNKNNYISLIDKKIIASSDNILDVIRETIDNVDVSILTMFYGQDLNENDKRAINEMLNSEYSHLEIYDMQGDQEVFDLILILE